MFAKRALCALLFAAAATTGSVTATPLPMQDDLGHRIEWDASLSEAFLRTAPAAKAAPSARLLLSHYDTTQGLYAGYESVSGGRIIFKSSRTPAGSLFLRVQAAKPGTAERIATIATMGQSPKTGATTLLVAGVDIEALMAEIKGNPDAAPPEADVLRRFLVTREGRDFVEMVPAVYELLETLDADRDDLAAFKRPLGLVRMALDVISGVHSGTPNLAAAIGQARADALRAACGQAQCRVKAHRFAVHADGLFDILSEIPSAAPAKALLAKPNAPKPAWLAQLDSTLQPPTRAQAKLCDPDDQACLDAHCSGDCGADCGWGYSIAECESHDACVVRYGHAACAYDAPGDYSSFMDALWAVTLYHLGLHPESDSMDTSPPVPNGSNGYYYPLTPYAPNSLPFCTLDVYCIDGGNSYTGYGY